MLTCCPLFLAARQAWAHDFFWGFFSGNKSFSVASKKSKQLSSLMLLFFVCANLCCSRKSFHQQKENRKEKMVVSFIAFTLFSSLAFFFLKRKKKRYIAKTKKKTLYLVNSTNPWRKKKTFFVRLGIEDKEKKNFAVSKKQGLYWGTKKLEKTHKIVVS